MYAEVAIAHAHPKLDKIYHYSIPCDLHLEIGSQVVVPFGSAQRIGFVVGFAEKSDVTGIKPISSLASQNPVFTKQGLQLARWISQYYLCSFAAAIRTILPPKTRNREIRKKDLKHGSANRNK